MVVKKHLPDGEQGGEKYWPPNLPKVERLSDKKILSALFKNNLQARSSSGPIMITIVPNNKWEIAILIRKSMGTAVRRNHVKRKIREAFRWAKHQTVNPFSVIFSVHTNPENADLNNLSAVLLSTLNK